LSLFLSLFLSYALFRDNSSRTQENRWKVSGFLQLPAPENIY